MKFYNSKYKQKFLKISRKDKCYPQRNENQANIGFLSGDTECWKIMEQCHQSSEGGVPIVAPWVKDPTLSP